jgi:hypothetical protein
VIDDDRHFDFRYRGSARHHVVDGRLLVALDFKTNAQALVFSDRLVDQLLEELRRFRFLVSFADDDDIAWSDVFANRIERVGVQGCWK